jgi:protein-tyrosine phosphatase
MVKVLFVCMGNICRSPTAEGVFTHLVERQNLSHLIDVDSGGTHAYHVGEPPDSRAQQAALQRGVQMSELSARRVYDDDFERFDYIVPMDRENQRNLLARCPQAHQHKVRLLLDFVPSCAEDEVPDPYYGNQRGFERVLDLVEQGAKGLLLDILDTHLKPDPEPDAGQERQSVRPRTGWRQG